MTSYGAKRQTTASRRMRREEVIATPVGIGRICPPAPLGEAGEAEDRVELDRVRRNPCLPMLEIQTGSGARPLSDLEMGRSAH